LPIIPETDKFKSMRISWKEVLVIFVVAILVTIASGLLARVKFLYCAPFTGRPYVGPCAWREAVGWPLPFLLPESSLTLESPLTWLFFDLVFYFSIISLVWVGVKLTLIKLKKS